MESELTESVKSPEQTSSSSHQMDRLNVLLRSPVMRPRSTPLSIYFNKRMFFFNFETTISVSAHRNKGNSTTLVVLEDLRPGLANPLMLLSRGGSSFEISSTSWFTTIEFFSCNHNLLSNEYLWFLLGVHFFNYHSSTQHCTKTLWS